MVVRNIFTLLSCEISVIDCSLSILLHIQAKWSHLHIKSRSTASALLSANALLIMYRQTDKTLEPVMTTRCSKFDGNFPLLHSASRAPYIDRYAPDIRPWRLTMTRTFDLDLWPWPGPGPLTLTSKQGKRHVTVMSKHDFEHLTLTFDLRPWPTIPA